MSAFTFMASSWAAIALSLASSALKFEPLEYTSE